jgi:hypothetical protein
MAVENTWSYTSTPPISLHSVVLKLSMWTILPLPLLPVREPARCKIKCGVRTTRIFFTESSGLREDVYTFTTNKFHEVGTLRQPYVSCSAKGREGGKSDFLCRKVQGHSTSFVSPSNRFQCARRVSHIFNISLSTQTILGDGGGG